MRFQSFITAWDVAQQHNLNHADLFILNQIFRAENNSGTVMKIVNSPGASVSRATLHARVKKLCKDGFLIKKEDPQNMRQKTVEPGEKFKEFLVKLKEVDGV